MKKDILEMEVLKRNCVISTVGKDSIHREWIQGNPDFDLHLIVYDNSYKKFCNDTKFIISQKGYKLKSVYKYYQAHPEYLDKYDYFFIPDDDILMDEEKISSIFRFMEKYHLQIAQPALSDSYYTFEHTIRDKFCMLRYTNFVELMVPCFSREALKKVLITFNGNNCGWGLSYHWPQLLGFTGREIAVIDELSVIHTRPIQSMSAQNISERDEYLKKYNLNRQIIETGFVPTILDKIEMSESLIKERNIYLYIERLVGFMADHLNQFISTSANYSIGLDGLLGISQFLIVYYRVSEKRKYFDKSLSFMELASSCMKFLERDMTLKSGLPGFSWYVEYLVQHGFFENNTDEILEDIYKYLDTCVENVINLNISDLIGLAYHYVIRMTNPHFDTDIISHSQERERLITIFYSIDDWSKTIDVHNENKNPEIIADCILLICLAKKVLILPEVDVVLLRMIDVFENVLPNERVSYLQKSYIMILASGAINNEDLKNKIIQDIFHYKIPIGDSYLQQVMNVYLFYKIHLNTKEEFFKSRAIEVLYTLIDGNKIILFDQIANDANNKGILKISDLIRISLVFVSILSDKDLELDNCIL